MIHVLKIAPAHFLQVKAGVKTFEIRENSDRGFQAGDTAILQHFYPDSELPNAEIEVLINYVTNFEQRKNMVVFGFSIISKDKELPTETTYGLTPKGEASLASSSGD